MILLAEAIYTLISHSSNIGLKKEDQDSLYMRVSLYIIPVVMYSPLQPPVENVIPTALPKTHERKRTVLRI